MATDDTEAIIAATRAQLAERNGHPPEAAPPCTLAGLLLAHLRETYRPLYRREQLVYADALGQHLDERTAGRGPPTPLLRCLLTASDCPRDRQGKPSEAGLLHVWKQHLAIAWADLLAMLPEEAACAEIAAGGEDELRRRLAALLGRVVTIGRRMEGGKEMDVQARSLLDCALAWAVPGIWGRIRSYWLWSRLEGSEPLPADHVLAAPERRRRLRVALRIELAGQLGVRPLCDWRAAHLTEMVEHYGLGHAIRLGGRRRRAIELTPDYLADLLGDPESDREPGEEPEEEG
jgi:hypothetical protein